MIILSWNCRGLGNPAIIPALVELVKTRKPDVIFLFETLSVSSRVEEVRVRLKFESCFSISSIGRSGGLCVFWKSLL
ncbi:hypothetical protein ACS0TY_011099 [Phlomoides rotata]